jgi:DNA modification methylase
VQGVATAKPPGRSIEPGGSMPLENIEWRPIAALRQNPRNPRTHSRKQIKLIATSIEKFGFLNPILVDDADMVIAGHGRLEAAKLQNLSHVPIVRFTHLSAAQKRAYVIADNKIAEQAGWDRDMLAIELGELADLLPVEGIDITVTGFGPGEIDVLFADIGEEKPEPEDQLPPTAGPAVTRRNELWVLGKHRILSADSREPSAYVRLMNGEKAAMAFTDPPYNVPIAGHVQGRGRVKHQEFACGSGEMSDAQFRKFLLISLGSAAQVSRDGAVHFICMDWRHIDTLMAVGREIYGSMLNLVVWNKTNSGQGSFYRSQHELIGVFRVGETGHQNNVELGKHGRNRSNVWTYSGVNSFGAGRDDALAMHPTVKPVALVADAMRDCTSRGDIILDAFLGSGTTVMAAEKIGRRCFGLEIEPTFLDVAIRRWQAYTSCDAILEGDGRTFDEISEERLSSNEADAQTTVIPAPSPNAIDPEAQGWTVLCEPIVSSTASKSEVVK